MIAAQHTLVLCYDNLSYISAEISDCLCMLATGGGYATRELYRDAEEIILNVTRPVVITSIEDAITRSDLLDRSLVVTLEPIPDDSRRTEEDLRAKYDEAVPRLLGAILDAMAMALRNYNATKAQVHNLLRLADFYVWALAAEDAFGVPAGSFGRAFAANRANANRIALESSNLVTPLKRFLLQQPDNKYAGAATELLRKLNETAGTEVTRARSWPKNPQKLSDKLTPRRS